MSNVFSLAELRNNEEARLRKEFFAEFGTFLIHDWTNGEMIFEREEWYSEEGVFDAIEYDPVSVNSTLIEYILNSKNLIENNRFICSLSEKITKELKKNDMRNNPF